MNEITPCTPPAKDRGTEATHYLPITENGLYDRFIYHMDAAIGEINSAAFGYDPEQIRSRHEGSDSEGCVDTLSAPAELDTTPVVEYLTKVVDALKALDADLKSRTDEQWVERVVSNRYALQGSSVKNSATGIEGLEPLVTKVGTTTNDAAKGAFGALRGSVVRTRDLLAQAVDAATGADFTPDAWDVGLSASVIGAPIGGVKYGAHALGSFLWNSERPFDPEHIDIISNALKSDLSVVENAGAANDEAIKALKTAVEALVFPTGTGSAVPASATRPAPAPTTPPASTEPVSSAPVTGGGGGPVGDTASDPLEDLFNEPDPEVPPSMSDPGMGGMPSSPLGGGSPMDSGMGGGSPLGGAGSDPFGSEPLSDALTDPEKPEDEKPLDDLTDEDEDKKDDELFPEDDKDGKDDIDGDIDADVDTPDDTDKDEDKPDETPEDGDVAPVAADPADTAPKDDTAARTVDVGGGRQVTFPSVALADAAKAVVEAAEAGNPKSLYLAASENGFNLPPMGQDVGQQVPPALLREGDVVVNKDGMGVFIGNGDVLWESGEIKPLADVATFDGQNQGLFRMEETAPPASDGLSGPAQPVGDGSAAPVASGEPVTATSQDASVSTPGAVTDQAGTPGVPTDTKADDLSATSGTEAGAGFGSTDNGAAGLDPSTAFPS